MSEALYICQLCDEVVTDPHVHSVWRFSHPVLVEQKPVVGLSLEANNFAVIALAGWIDMSMHCVYRRGYQLRVRLS